MRLLTQLLLVAAGSAVGGVARWLLGAGIGRWCGTAWPIGTFVINVLGSFFLGWFLTAITEQIESKELTWLRADDLRLAIGVGFTGAFTTFSTFEWETSGLLSEGKWWSATLYLVSSVACGLVAVRAGILLGRL